MTSGDDNRGYSQARPTKTGDSGVSSTRAIREKLEAQFGGQFSSKLAAEYSKLTPEQREGMEGMTAREAKDELRESAKKREKLEETMRNTEPAWKGDPVKEKPALKIKGDGVIDVGREDVLIGGRGSNDAGMTNEPDSNSGDSLPPSPGSGTYVLGSVGGVVQWLATETCSTSS